MTKEIKIKPLTKRQREAILDRDDHTSQMRTYSEEKGWHLASYCDNPEDCNDLQVHHIKPRRKCKTQEEADNPRNLITLFSCLHTGICKKRRIK